MTNLILDTISARLGRTPLDGDALEQRFAALKQTASPAVQPAMANYLAFFTEQAKNNLFEISQSSDPEKLVASLGDHPLPLALSPQPSLRVFPWRGNLTDNFHAPDLGVVEAVAGIAETGTLAVRSTDAPSGLLFLSEELLIIVRESRIVPFQEDLWRRLSPGGYRALHFISGPSRTADVEQTLQVGAHGPRRVYLWLISETGNPSSPTP